MSSFLLGLLIKVLFVDRYNREHHPVSTYVYVAIETRYWTCLDALAALPIGSEAGQLADAGQLVLTFEEKTSENTSFVI